MIRVFSVLTAFAVVAVACVNTSEASVSIELVQGLTTITVHDGGVGDSNPAAGAVTFIGSIGNFNINVTTGLGPPALGTAALPTIDLNSVDVSGGGGTLSLRVTATDNLVVPNPLSFSLGVGGTFQGTLQASAYAASSNLAFDTSGVQIASLTLGPGADSGTVGGSANSVTQGGSGMYSLTIDTQLTHTGSGVSSFDAELKAIPEPTSIAAWGILGAMGLGLTWYRRRRRSS